MVETTARYGVPSSNITEHIRGRKNRERLERIKAAQPKSTVRVVPRDDTIRRNIAHPVVGPFHAEGAAEWPLDRFTQRRIDDGDVTVEGEPVKASRRSSSETPPAG